MGRPASEGDDRLEAVFTGISRMLAKDGFRAAWQTDEDGLVDFDVVAGENACAECLSPMVVIRSVVENALAGTGYALGKITLPDGLGDHGPA